MMTEGSHSIPPSRYYATTNSTSLVLLSAHYDSRGSFGSTRAPGANDDGSGTTHLLAIARAVKENRITFHSNVELVAFAGEEQGLRGSYEYASKHHL
jgi:Zn-dependent M28 family amino/carboxypeptidase